MAHSLKMKNDGYQKNENKLFVALMCLFVALFFVRNVLEIAFPVVLYLGIVAVIAAISTKEQLMALALSFIPLSAGFQFKYAILICVAVFIVKFGATIKRPAYIFPIVLMFSWELLHIISGDLMLMETLRGFSELIFLGLILMSDDFDFSNGVLMRILAYTTVASAIIVFWVSLREVDYNLTAFLESGARFGQFETDSENFKFTFNPNSLGLMSNMGIMGILMLITNKKANKLDYLTLILSVIIGIMTLSRSFLVCLVMIAICYVLFRNVSLNKKILSILAIVAICLIVLVIMNAVFPDIIENYVNRFKEEDITNGRDDLFGFYNKHIFSGAEYLLFGVGLQNYGEKVNRIHGASHNVCHNAYQELVVVWGVVGLALFIYLIILLIKKAKEMNSSITAFSFVPLGIFLFKLMSGQFISSGVEILYFALIFVYMCYPQKEQIRRQAIGKE